MGRLVYSTSASLDGFINDEDGNFDFTEPTEEVHQFIDDALRSIGTHLYGRRLYEVMRVWETYGREPGAAAPVADFARIWDATDKVVYSRTLPPEEITTARTRLERTFDPAEVERMKADGELLVGGAELASHAFAAGLVDEVHLYLAPVILGGGTRALPNGIRTRLELTDERRFDNGTVYVRYRVER
jgi:dihydrofolate reductase